MTTQLFTAQTANGSTQAVPVNGRHVSFVAAGTFGGATLTVEVSPDSGTTWVSTGTTLTAAGAVEVTYGEGLLLRVTLSGATGTTSLNVWTALRSW
jgi:hypothetical protein